MNESILLIGNKRTGKTIYIKENLLTDKSFIFDSTAEYIRDKSIGTKIPLKGLCLKSVKEIINSVAYANIYDKIILDHIYETFQNLSFFNKVSVPCVITFNSIQSIYKSKISVELFDKIILFKTIDKNEVVELFKEKYKHKIELK